MRLSELPSITEKIEVPVDEYGIPDTKEFITQALEVIDEPDIVWGGRYDLHHMAWPGYLYRSIQTKRDTLAGSYYRGSNLLKVDGPRDLHEYLHRVAEEPTPPNLDVLDQFAMENKWLQGLRYLLRKDTIKVGDKHVLMAEQTKHERYLRAVERMPKSEFGILPNQELLMGYTLDEAKVAIRALTAVSRVDRRGEFVA